MKIRSLAALGVLSNVRDCIGFLREHRVLARGMNCPKCRNAMVEEINKANKLDGARFRCRKANCRNTTTIRKNSFFERSKIDLVNLVILLYCWAMDVPQRQIVYEIDVSPRIVVDWLHFIREICSTELIQSFKKIGGKKMTVCIDETLIAKRKPCSNFRARKIKPIWLWGAICLETKEICLQLVPETGRTKATMEELIKANVAPHSEIWSDCFGSYRDIEKLGMGYTHRTVNHSLMYVTDEGVTTNCVEGLWTGVKEKFKKMHGTRREMIPSYLDEFQWRRRHLPHERFAKILEAIANNPKYDVNRLEN